MDAEVRYEERRSPRCSGFQLNLEKKISKTKDNLRADKTHGCRISEDKRK